jgi:hypothetical protein
MRVTVHKFERGQGIETASGRGPGLFEMRLRADLRPGRQVGLRVPVRLGVFRRRAGLSRTWHGSESNKTACEIKNNLRA